MNDTKEIKEVCLRFLACREHSQKGLLNKCLIKGYDKHEILAVIEDLAREGWQDDLRYAESYARHRIQKGYGPVFISYQLQQNGVDAVNLDGIVVAVAGSWMAVLEQVYSKKYKHDNPQKVCIARQEWAKRSRFLMQRGFPADMVSALFNHLSITIPKF
ncbi:MAG: regulatory protein RecX [Methylovulum sp.]|nr:regulatory protein RecX [Methylovulum sp.]